MTVLTPIERKKSFLKADEDRIKGSLSKRIKTPVGWVNVRVGGKENGPAMVFWPSLMMEGSMWSYQYEYYTSEYRVVLIDSPGVGGSDALRKPVYLEDSGEIVICVLDALGIEKCIFGGNSWGAMLAAVLPAWYPDRVIASMSINGTASLPTTLETVKMSVMSALLYMNATMPHWWIGVAQDAFAGDSAEATNPEFIEYINCVLNEDPKSIHYQLQGILLGRVDRHELLKTIKDVPVLVIAGEEDRQFAVHIVRKMANAIVGSKFVVLPETAHLAAREQPDLVNAEIDKFLSELKLPVPAKAYQHVKRPA